LEGAGDRGVEDVVEDDGRSGRHLHGLRYFYDDVPGVLGSLFGRVRRRFLGFLLLGNGFFYPLVDLVFVVEDVEVLRLGSRIAGPLFDVAFVQVDRNFARFAVGVSAVEVVTLRMNKK
jgi:hypothetical protein